MEFQSIGIQFSIAGLPVGTKRTSLLPQITVKNAVRVFLIGCGEKLFLFGTFFGLDFIIIVVDGVEHSVCNLGLPPLRND